MSLEVRPITFRKAIEFVKQHHRHHGSAPGCKWCLSVYNNGVLCGVAICGRPVARNLDDGMTAEVTRLCTDGTHNACSILYGACAKVAKAMGYQKIITYILETEPGTSLKASGWQLAAAKCGGASWDKPSRRRTDKAPTCPKQRWEKQLSKGGVANGNVPADYSRQAAGAK